MSRTWIMEGRLGAKRAKVLSTLWAAKDGTGERSTARFIHLTKKLCCNFPASGQRRRDQRSSARIEDFSESQARVRILVFTPVALPASYIKSLIFSSSFASLSCFQILQLLLCSFLALISVLRIFRCSDRMQSYTSAPSKQQPEDGESYAFKPRAKFPGSFDFPAS
jgi:hypothetical protein